MTRRWKVCLALLALIMLTLMCSVLLGLIAAADPNGRAYLEMDRDGLHFDLQWEERKPSDREEIALSFELNDYYWETQEVYYFNIADLPNSGRQERDILVVDLTVTNKSGRSAPLMSWYVTNAEGRRFEATTFSDIPFQEDISVAAIRSEATLRGKVAFEVPHDHLPLWLHCAEYTAEAKIQ